jgi:hypothetical protein
MKNSSSMDSRALSISCREQVARLDVSVYESGGVRRLLRLARFDADPERLTPVHPALAIEVSLETLALKELHRVVGAAVGRHAEVV